MRAKALIFICFLLLFVIALSVDSVTSEFIIATTGNFHGSDAGNLLEIKNNDNWFGLFMADTSFLIEPVKIEISPWFDGMLDKPRETTGVSVQFKDSSRPLILINTSIGLKPGPVSTWFHGQHPIIPGYSLSIHADEYHIIGTGEISDESYKYSHEFVVLNYQVKLYYGEYNKSSQTLVTYDRSAKEYLPSLLWAGDLDHDGKSDLLLNIRNHYNVNHLALYLSSRAHYGEQVRLVAEFRTTGC